MFTVRIPIHDSWTNVLDISSKWSRYIWEYISVWSLLCKLIKLTNLFQTPSEANRDIMDWSGNKPLDYSRQRPSVSASTCSSEYQKYFLGTELNNNYHLGYQHIESPLSSAGNGIMGGTLGSALTRGKRRSQMRYATVSSGSGGGTVTRTQSLMTSGSYRRYKKPSVQSLLFKESNEDSDSEPTPRSKRDANVATDQPDEDKLEMLESESHERKLRSAPTRRKESFLRKTFRSAAGASRPPKDVVTNQST